MTLGLIRYVASVSQSYGRKRKGRVGTVICGASEIRSGLRNVQSNAYITTLWRERRNSLSVIETNTPIRAAPRKTTEELPGINSMKDDRN